MILYYTASGTLMKRVPERVYQGSNNANTIYFAAPFVNAQVYCKYTLPNGEVSTAYLMAGETSLAPINDGTNTLYMWSVDIPAAVTTYAGTVLVQFSVITATQKINTKAAMFTVEKGVAPNLPETPSADIYEKILAIVNDMNSSVEELKEKFGDYQPIITSEEPLLSDLVSDIGQAHKFVTQADIDAWNAILTTVAANYVPTSRTINGKALSSNIILNADDISDTDTTNKFVSASEKATWNGKQNALTFDSTPTAGSSNPVTSAGIKTAIDTAISSVYRFKGSVATYEDLPTIGLTVGDVYDVQSTGDNYAWTGTAWDKLAGFVDLSGYVPTNRTIAGIALSSDITAQALTDGLVYMNTTTDIDYVMGD